MNINGIGLTSPNVNVNGINTSGYGDKSESADIPEASPKKDRDEYIPSEEDKSIGLYRPAEDKEAARKRGTAPQAAQVSFRGQA